jgi:hypothetical protein
LLVFVPFFVLCCDQGAATGQGVAVGVEAAGESGREGLAGWEANVVEMFCRTGKKSQGNQRIGIERDFVPDGALGLAFLVFENISALVTHFDIGGPELEGREGDTELLGGGSAGNIPIFPMFGYFGEALRPVFGRAAELDAFGFGGQRYLRLDVGDSCGVRVPQNN